MKEKVLCLVILIVTSVSRADPEPWYLTFDYQTILSRTYSGPIKKELDKLNPDYETGISFSLAAYFPVNPNVFWGPSLIYTGDAYQSNQVLSESELGVTQLGASAIYSMSGEVGAGLYGSFDLGYALGPASFNIDLQSEQATLEQEKGLGVILGVGYGFNVSPGFRLAPKLSYQCMISDSTYQFVKAGLSLIF